MPKKKRAMRRKSAKLGRSRAAKTAPKPSLVRHRRLDSVIFIRFPSAADKEKAAVMAKKSGVSLSSYAVAATIDWVRSGKLLERADRAPRQREQGDEVQRRICIRFETPEAKLAAIQAAAKTRVSLSAYAVAATMEWTWQQKEPARAELKQAS